MSSIVENPRGGCVLAGINSNLAAMDRVCPILHSGPGCCMQTTAAEQGQSGHKNSPFVSGVSLPCSNMLEKEVVFGGIKKLETTVQGSIDIIDADAYFILTGCTAGIIGDDVESVAQSFRDKGYPVYAIDTPGFEGDGNLGYEVTWNNLIDQVIEERPKDEKLVNIFGILPYKDPYWAGNLEEIARLLGKLGLRVNTFYTDKQGIENVKNSSAASLNIIINPWLFKGPAEKFEAKFGVPSLRIPGLPVGATDTTAFLRAVGEALKLDAETVEKAVEEEEAYLYSYFEKIIGVFSWKKFAVVGDANAAVGISRFLANDFSFTPGVVILSEQLYRPEDKERVLSGITNLEYAKAPEVVFAKDQFEINEALKAHTDVTLVVGSSNDREAASYLSTQFIEATFPVNNRVILNRALAGYRGGLTFVEDLYSNL